MNDFCLETHKFYALIAPEAEEYYKDRPNEYPKLYIIKTEETCCDVKDSENAVLKEIHTFKNYNNIPSFLNNMDSMSAKFYIVGLITLNNAATIAEMVRSQETEFLCLKDVNPTTITNKKKFYDEKVSSFNVHFDQFIPVLSIHGKVVPESYVQYQNYTEIMIEASMYNVSRTIRNFFSEGGEDAFKAIVDACRDYNGYRLIQEEEVVIKMASDRKRAEERLKKKEEKKEMKKNEKKEKLEKKKDRKRKSSKQ